MSTSVPPDVRRRRTLLTAASPLGAETWPFGVLLAFGRGTRQAMWANDVQRLSSQSSARHARVASVTTAFVLGAVLLTTACTGSARSTSAYLMKATNTADEVVSASRTVLLAAQLGDDGRSFAPTIAVTIEDAETDAETARDSFSSIQPPDAASDEVRATILPIVQHACDVIAGVRIAARRADGGLSQIAAPLEPIADQLDAFSTRYS